MNKNGTNPWYRRRSLYPLAFLVVTWFLGSFPVQALAPRRPSPRPKIEVHAKISDDFSTVTGTARYEIPATYHATRTDAPKSLTFYLYPNRFRNGTEQLPTYAEKWMYPNGASPGKIQLNTVTVDGSAILPRLLRNGTLAQVPMANPSATTTVNISFTVHVPERRGRFGRYRDVLMLAGGWYPRLTEPTNEIPYGLVDLTAHIDTPPRTGLVFNNDVQIAKQHRHTYHFSSANINTATVIAIKKMEIYRRGDNIRYVTANHYAVVKRPETFANTPHIPTRAMSVAETAASLFRAHAPTATEAKVLLVEIPCMDQLIHRGEGLTMVSDQLYKIIPTPKALFFHDLAVAQGVAAGLVRDHKRPTDHSEFAQLAADIVGYKLASSYRRQIEDAPGSVAQMLRFAAFIPYIDNLLYAPQIPFADSYSPAPFPPRLTRDAPFYAYNHQPHARGVLFKLNDYLSESGNERLLTQYLSGSADFAQLINQSLGAFAASFESQWMTRLKTAAYRISELTTTRPEGTSYRNCLILHQFGAPVTEQVTVRFIFGRGHHQDTVRNISKKSTRICITAGAPARDALLDPNGRLREDARQTVNHPRYDNRIRKPWRPPLLSQFMVWAESETLRPYVDVSFTMKRKYELTNSISFSGHMGPRQNGGTVQWTRYAGRKKSENARSFFIAPYLSLYHYAATAKEEQYIPARNRYAATISGLSMLMGSDSDTHFFDPLKSERFYISLGYNVGRDKNDTPVQYGKGDLRFFVVRSLGIRHTFAVYGGFLAKTGTPPASALPSLSNRQYLRGFDIDETYGQATVYSVAEYRHTVFGNTPLRFPLNTHLSRLQGVLFSGVGSVTPPGRYTGWDQPNTTFAEIGYGLRFHLLLLGVSPYLLALDVAVPVYPQHRTRADLNGTAMPRSGYKLFMGITQTY